MDDAAASEVETEGDMDAPRGGAGDTPSRRTKIHTVEESRKHLEEVHLIEPEDELDGETLAGILVRVLLFPGMSQVARDTVWSVALILVGMTSGKARTPALSTCMEWMVSEFKEAVSSITQSAIDEVKTASSALMATSMQFQATATSYQDILTSKGPPINPAAVATTMDVRVRVREGVKAHQILIDTWNHGEGILWGISDAGLVESANATLWHLEDPLEHRFISIRCLGNGGVLLEMDSESAVGWLSTPATQASFLSHFAPNALVKEWAFSLVVQFIPLYFKLDKESEMRQVEKDNSLPDSSLLWARWIKLAHWRACDQTCGHIILVASAADTANKILTNSLVICQKCVYTEKCQKEPTRCLKCQQWGHLSYDCKLTPDTCGTCAGRHRTANCPPGSWPRCISCGIEGHMSWSRNCPVFIQKCDEMNRRLTENAMLYFPTNEPWTHAIQPPKPAYHLPPSTAMHNTGHPPGAFRGPYRQSSLQFPQVQQRPHGDAPPSHAPASMQGHENNAPPARTTGDGQVQPREWGDSDPMNEFEGLPDIPFI